MNKLHLICNAHIDPVWQWEWEEGAAAAVSTFRVAARFCEEYEGFVFNHNEAILYKWIEEYEPELFKKIQKLVRDGRWHIIGGWYLQPDCNMPSGESLVRQILMGKKYFKEKFGCDPTTAINFDSFGHSRGLVQIMKKSGFDSYIFQRPQVNELELPGEDFIWVGLDGSEITAHRLFGGYNTLLGKATEKIEKYLAENTEKVVGLVAWGVGNHGGGPSRIDLEAINKLAEATKEVSIIHSTPEAYFNEIKELKTELPKFNRDLNSTLVGCYTSQIRIKQKHRQLENELYTVEKMLSSAALQGLVKYPENELKEAFEDMMTAQFHDILPGSSVQLVENSSLRIMEHGLEIAARLKARAFFALAAGQKAASDGEVPILVYNPHPFKVKGIFECEFMLADQNWKEEFTLPVVYKGEKSLPSQPEKENSNISLDWRKRVAFEAVLEPSQMNRFDVKLSTVPNKPQPQLKAENGYIIFQNEEMEVIINCDTGLIDEYKVKGVSYLKKGAFQPLVIDDYDDAWGGNRYSFREVCGKFQLMQPDEGTQFSGIRNKVIPSVRVIEDGDVRTVVEVLLKYKDSAICQRYKLPKHGSDIEVEINVNWFEKTRFLKLSVPTLLETARYIGQTAYGVQELNIEGKETVSQKWCAAVSDSNDRVVTCVNDGIYGSDFKDGEIRISLLRSPGYTCMDMSMYGVDRPMMPEDRYSPRIDQGERVFNFRFRAGKADEVMNVIDREALVYNEKPYALSFFPSGEGVKPEIPIVLEGDVVQMTALKKAEASEDFIIRLFEPAGKPKNVEISIPFLGLKQKAEFKDFEIKSFRLDIKNKSLTETGLME